MKRRVVLSTTGGVREFFTVLNFTGWKTFRPGMSASRSLYTHAGGNIPSAYLSGNNNRAMRAFSWSNILALNLDITNVAKSATVYIGKIEALEETSATTHGGATLSVSGTALAVPALRGGTQADSADYLECADVTNASSCVAYNDNGWPLNHTSAPSTVPSAAVEGGADADIAVEYTPGSATARVEVSVFEWAADARRMGPY